MTAPSTDRPCPWTRLVQFVARHRGPSLAVGLVLLVAAGLQAPRLPFDNDPTGVFPANQPDVRFWLDMTRRFGGLDMLMVGLEEPSGAMTPEGLAAVARVTDALGERKADGVLLARSVTNLPSVREDEEGGVDTDLLIPELPTTTADLASVVARVRTDAQAVGSLIGDDLASYLVLVRADVRKDAGRVAALVREVVEAERGPLSGVYYGAPFVANFVSRQVYAQLGWLAPAFVLLLLGLSLGVSRRPAVVAAALGAAGLSLLGWLGLLAVTGQTLTTTSVGAALPVLAIAAVVFARAAEARALGLPPAEAFPLGAVLLLLGGALALALTAFVPVPYLAHFGRTAALGLVSVAVTGLLVLVPLTAGFGARGTSPAPSTRRLSPRVAAALALAVVGFGLWGGTGLRFWTNPRDLFRPDDEVGRGLAFFDRHFGGADLLQVHLKGDLRDPAVTARLLRLSDLLEGDGAFTDVRSVAQIVSSLGRSFNGLARIPPSRDALANLWFLLEGNDDVRPLVSSERDEAMVAARIPFPPKPGADWVAAATRAAERSAEAGPVGTRHRLQALRYRYGVLFDDARLDTVLAAAGTPEPAETAARRLAAAGTRVRAFLDSEESPVAPEDDEWDALAAVLQDRSLDRVRTAAERIATWKGVVDEGLPRSVVDQLASTLVTRFDGRLIEDRARALLADLVTPARPSALPPAFVDRAEGALADLLDPPPAAPDAPITVSGFPALAGRIEAELLSGTWLALQLLWWALGAVTWAITRRSSVAVRALGESAVATLATIGVARLTGLHADSASATLYLLAPLLPFFLSRAVATGGDDARVVPERAATGIALGLGAAAASLLATGVPPVMHLGAVMALSVVFAVLVTRLSARIGG
jgi:predicted RND superfamily exporter protein